MSYINIYKTCKTPKKYPIKTFTVPSKTLNKVLKKNQYYVVRISIKNCPSHCELPTQMMTLKRLHHLFTPPSPINVTTITRHHNFLLSQSLKAILFDRLFTAITALFTIHRLNLLMKHLLTCK